MWIRNFISFPLSGPSAGAAASPASVGEPIKAFDKFGREVFITRQDWIDGVLRGQLAKEWSNPDRLAGIVLQAFDDGFFNEVEEAAKHLHAIDPDSSRGASLLGILYLQTARPVEAERVFSAYLDQYGDDGVVLTNLAKAQAAQGRHEQAERTLWHALELDPNQDHGLLWYEVLHREKGGPSAGVEALRRIAGMPGSWRAQLWLATASLESRDIEAALALYQESLRMAGTPVPADLLVKMSGDLGNHGHLPEILTLVGPHFDAETHGLSVGNNLIKACIDTGHLDSARSLIRKLESLQRPDWKEVLGYWESELSKARLQTAAPVPADEISVRLLQLSGPLWFVADHATSEIVPPPAPEAPHIAFLGSLFETAGMSSEVTLQQSNGQGRMSRALPLFLNETVCLHSDARTTTLIAWIANGGGGFGIFGSAPDLEEMARHARQMTAGDEGAEQPPDFLVSTHLVTRGENWKLQLALVRTIDGKTLFSHDYDFTEAGFHPIADRVTGDLLSALAREADIDARPPPAGTRVEASELDHYLFRLEQTLAVRCGTMAGTHGGFLSNPAEILDGILYLCIQNPSHIPSRILLWRALDGLKSSEPELVRSMAAKVRNLQAEYPLPSGIQVSLDHEFDPLFAGWNGGENRSTGDGTGE